MVRLAMVGQSSQGRLSVADDLHRVPVVIEIQPIGGFIDGNDFQVEEATLKASGGVSLAGDDTMVENNKIS